MSNDIARTSDRRIAAFVATIGGSMLIAGLVGVVTGAVMAKVAPEDKFSWVGLAIAPLWLALEIFFELVVGVFELHSRAARLAGIAALLSGFYITWFLMRPL